MGIPPSSNLDVRSLQQAQAKSHLGEFDAVVALGILILSAAGSDLHGPGQDFVLVCLYSGGDAAMSEMALEPTGLGDEICLPVIGGRGLEASLLDEGERNLPGTSAIASLQDRRLKRQELCDIEDESWHPEFSDDVVVH